MNREETIENDLPSIENKKSLPDLEKLVNKIEKNTSFSDVKAEQEGADKSTTRKAIKQKVMVKEPQKEEEIIIPEEVYKQKDKQYRDDELTYLIDKMERVDETGTLIEQEEGIHKSEKKLNTVEKVFDKFLQNLTLSKGALLVRDGDGVYSVALARGLSETSVDKLKFDGSERVYKNIIAKRKLLFIKEDAFVDNERREKFDIFDAEKIRSLFIAPIGDEDNIRGIMLVCITMGERISPEIITKEIKKIIKIIKKYI